MTHARVLTKWSERLGRPWWGPSDPSGRLRTSRMWFWSGGALFLTGLALVAYLAATLPGGELNAWQGAAAPMIGLAMMAWGYWLVPAAGEGSAGMPGQQGVRATFLAALGTVFAVISLDEFLYYYSFGAAVIALVLLAFALWQRRTWRRVLTVLPGLAAAAAISVAMTYSLLT